MKPEAYSNGPVWDWFGGTRSSYLVVPRALLCGMPLEWQEKFVALLNQADEVYNTDTIPADYWVRAKGEGGRFVADPYSNYRYPPPLPYKTDKGE